jgi:hypothetical protein
VKWNDHDTCAGACLVRPWSAGATGVVSRPLGRDTACISGACAGLVSFGEALPLVCSLMRRATTAAATWKRLEARLRQERVYLSQPPLFDLTTSACCEVLCSGAGWHAHSVLIVAEKPRA